MSPCVQQFALAWRRKHAKRLAFNGIIWRRSCSYLTASRSLFLMVCANNFAATSINL